MDRKAARLIPDGTIFIFKGFSRPLSYPDPDRIGRVNTSEDPKAVPDIGGRGRYGAGAAAAVFIKRRVFRLNAVNDDGMPAIIREPAQAQLLLAPVRWRYPECPFRLFNGVVPRAKCNGLRIGLHIFHDHQVIGFFRVGPLENNGIGNFHPRTDLRNNEFCGAGGYGSGFYGYFCFRADLLAAILKSESVGSTCELPRVHPKRAIWNYIAIRINATFQSWKIANFS